MFMKYILYTTCYNFAGMRKDEIQTGLKMKNNVPTYSKMMYRFILLFSG